MTMLKRLFFVICLTLVPLHFAQAAEVLNLTDVAVPVKVDGSPHSAKEVQTAILNACRARGWTPRLEGSTVVASILVRGKHYAEVAITYDAKKYSINYRDSRDLKYNAEKNTIHRNYNNWVARLSGTIQQNLGVNAQQF